MDAKQSQRNIFAAAAAGCIGSTGFTLVMPFLPLYIAELGTTDFGEIAMWSGLTLAATPAVTAISAPLWGRVGDRYGSKVLVIRSIAAFILTKAAMAFVTAPWQLLALRALLGVFAGYGALTISMAAESAPRHRMAHAIGIVQTGHRLGPAIGPVIGGALAPLVGLRNVFLAASVFYTAALLLVVFIYREPREGRAPRALRAGREVFAQLLRLPGFVLALFLIFGLQTVDRSFGPVLPLYVEQVGIESARVPIVSGVLFSLAAVSAAFGAFLAGRLLLRFSAKRVIVVGSLAAALGMAAIVVAPSLWIVGAAMMVVGAAIGTATTTVWAVAGSLLPADAHATGFGLMTTANLIGLAFSPVIAGFIGGSGLRIVFVADVILLLILGGLVARKLTSDALRPAPDAPIAES
ncbi:MAG: MFS transporter [Acidobacteriota bacterium]|nr:MFS transporter [Acidobacteriota bacterium]